MNISPTLLTANGSAISTATAQWHSRPKGNLFKGPFHIPRMLIKSSMLIDEIINK